MVAMMPTKVKNVENTMESGLKLNFQVIDIKPWEGREKW